MTVETMTANNAKAKGGLAPELSKTKKPLTKSLNDVQVITSYCHGLVNTHVRPVKGSGGWYDKFKKPFGKAQDHAKRWIHDLEPTIASKVPQSLINYNDTFTVAMKRVDRMLKPLGGKRLNNAQQTELHQLLKAVRARLGEERQEVESVYDELVTFSNQLEDDHKALFDGVDNIQNEIMKDKQRMQTIKTKINSVQNTIQKDSEIATSSEIGIGISIFVTITGIAFAVATGGAGTPLAAVGIGVVGIGGAIAGSVIYSEKVEQDMKKLHHLQSEYGDEKRQVSALTGVSKAVGGLKKSNEAAQKSLSGVLTVWKSLEEKLDGVIKDVDRTEDDAKASALLAKLDIDTARKKWKQLESFATNMQSSWENTKIVTLHPSKGLVRPAPVDGAAKLDELLAASAG